METHLPCEDNINLEQKIPMKQQPEEEDQERHLKEKGQEWVPHKEVTVLLLLRALQMYHQRVD